MGAPTMSGRYRLDIDPEDDPHLRDLDGRLVDDMDPAGDDSYIVTVGDQRVLVAGHELVEDDGLKADGGTPKADRERVRGTAGEHTHGLFLGKRWNDRAEENIENWGHQRHDTTLLALIEEIGEIAMAFENHNEPGGGPHPHVEPDSPHFEGRNLIGEMADLGRRTRDFLESNYPDPAGDGEGIEEYEIHGDPMDSERIFEEVDDAAPLLFQLYWAVESATKDTDSAQRGDSA